MLAFFFAYIAPKIETISEVKPYHANGDGLIWESGRVGNRHLQEGKQQCLPFFIQRSFFFIEAEQTPRALPDFRLAGEAEYDPALRYWKADALLSLRALPLYG